MRKTNKIKRVFIMCFVIGIALGINVFGVPKTAPIEAFAQEVSSDDLELKLNEALDLIKDFSCESTLLETIRKSASKSEIFPIFTLEVPTRWRAHYENTFQRYLPFYLFKSRVASASRSEIEECVDNIEQLNNKEKAYVLTAILLYERAKRKRAQVCLREEERACNEFKSFLEERKRNGQYVPKFVDERRVTGSPTDLLFPPYQPDESIDDSTWLRWIDVIKKQVQNNEIAFPAFKPNELDPLVETPYRSNDDYFSIRKSLFIKLDDSSLAQEWIESQRFCLYTLNKILDLQEPDNYLPSAACDVTIFSVNHGSIYCYMRPILVRIQKDEIIRDEYKYIEEFFKRIDEFNINTSKNANRTVQTLLLALRDYWCCFQTSSCPISGIEDTGFFYCNTSAYARRMSEIAAYLLSFRMPYTDEELAPYIILLGYRP